MMRVIFAMSYFCFIQLIHTNAQPSQQNVRYVKYSNTRAVGDVLKTPSASSTLECARICAELDNCTAYTVRANLVDNQRQCELLNMTGGCGTMQNNESYTLYGKFCIITSRRLNLHMTIYTKILPLYYYKINHLHKCTNIKIR